jgi:hypothetical protein
MFQDARVDARLNHGKLRDEAVACGVRQATGLDVILDRKSRTTMPTSPVSTT